MRPHQVEIRDPWDFDEVFSALHDFARAYPFDPEREDYLVHITTGTHVAQICLFLLTESRHFPARLIQTSPARRPRSGEPGTFKIIDLDLSKYDRLASRFAREREEATSILKSGIETRNAAFNRLIERIEQVASSSKAPILLTGPTGAGKSQLAERIYQLKKARRQIEGRFIEVNCATLRGDAAMSALFGHVKGAFTGALQDRPGLLKAADGGTLFLDEIAELGLDEQAMLLRAIEEKRFMPMGSDREAKSDFQLIAGSNRDLQAAAQSGSFRDDLLARIDLWAFRLPGLRERREDIAPNLDYELEQHTRRSGVRVTFNREARERFLSFTASPEATWERNFRDLSGAVTRMCTVAAGGRITVEVVNEEVERLRRAWNGSVTASEGPPPPNPRRRDGYGSGPVRYNWRECWKSSLPAAPCPPPGAPCSRVPGQRSKRPTTPIGCANTWPDSESPGTLCASVSSLQPADDNPAESGGRRPPGRGRVVALAGGRFGLRYCYGRRECYGSRARNQGRI